MYGIKYDAILVFIKEIKISYVQKNKSMYDKSRLSYVHIFLAELLYHLYQLILLILPY